MNINNELYALLLSDLKELPSVGAPSTMTIIGLVAYDIYLNIHGEVRNNVVIFLQ